MRPLHTHNHKNALHSYDNVINDARRRIDEAQASVNWLWGEYNYYSGECHWWSWWHCVTAGVHWAAAQVATGVLEAARGFLNTVVNGTVYWALDTARNALWAAQKVADDILQGVQWATRQTAWGVLEAARKVADAVLRGAEAATIETANVALTAADKIAQGVLSGVEAATLDTASGVLGLCRKTLDAAEAVVKGTLDVLAAALNAVGGALASVRLTGFLQLNGFSIKFQASRTRLLVGAGYDVVFMGTRYTGSLTVNINNPIESIVNTLLGEATKSIASAFKALAPFL